MAIASIKVSNAIIQCPNEGNHGEKVEQIILRRWSTAWEKIGLSVKARSGSMHHPAGAELTMKRTELMNFIQERTHYQFHKL